MIITWVCLTQLSSCNMWGSGEARWGFCSLVKLPKQFSKFRCHAVVSSIFVFVYIDLPNFASGIICRISNLLMVVCQIVYLFSPKLEIKHAVDKTETILIQFVLVKHFKCIEIRKQTYQSVSSEKDRDQTSGVKISAHKVNGSECWKHSKCCYQFHFTGSDAQQVWIEAPGSF